MTFMTRDLLQRPSALKRKPTTRMPTTTTAAKSGDQPALDDPPQDEELGQADRDDRHHEGEGGAQRQALAEQRLDDRDRARGVRVERDRDQDDDRHGERVVAAADLGDEVGRHEAVDERADADPDEDVRQDLADEVLRVRPGVAEALLDREPQVERRRAAAGPDLEDPRLDPALDARAGRGRARRRSRR